MEVSQSHYQRLSENPGVYLFLDEEGEVIYVGKAKNIRKRVSSYFTKKSGQGPKTKVLVSKINRIRTVNADSELESLLLEANLIKEYNPKYNARLTDGKSYIRAKIAIGERIPKVLFARTEVDKKAIYFGPFPSSSDLKIVFKIIRKIFPFQSVINHPRRFCLYYHLNLCPCPPMFENDGQIKDYKKNINHIVQFLNGQTKKIIKELEEERDELGEIEKFEEARNIQNKIDSIKIVTSAPRNPFEYVINPNLSSDLRSKELKELIKVLKINGIFVKNLRRIECYDISNTSGTNATGSMVVFINGEKDPSSYRRFQIKRPPKVIPNDFAMMREVISRRLTHPEWGKPDLIIVDGGKGQISSAKKAMLEQDEDIPIIGIAKREELLITSDFKIIRLPKTSPALNLVKRIRDEAHRFAITYHRKLRGKYLFSG